MRDSKKLSAKRRDVLYPEILKLCDRVCTAQIQPMEIDRVVRAGRRFRKLNYLEAVYMAQVIDGLDAENVVVDASDSIPARFQGNIRDNMRTGCRVEAHHFADRDYPAVSAASIVAKIQRDEAVAKLRTRFGDFGSGYPSDPKTRVFFTEWLRRRDDLPSFVRKSWKTWARLEQTLLAPF